MLILNELTHGTLGAHYNAALRFLAPNATFTVASLSASLPILGANRYEAALLARGQRVAVQVRGNDPPRA